MPRVNIEEKLYEDIREYCRLNKLTISVFVNDLLRKNFMVEKYDDAPPFFKKKNEVGKTQNETVLEKIRDEFSEKEFRDEYIIEPYPSTKSEEKKEDKELYTVEDIENTSKKTIQNHEELTPKEKARRRVQFL